MDYNAPGNQLTCLQHLPCWEAISVHVRSLVIVAQLSLLWALSWCDCHTSTGRLILARACVIRTIRLDIKTPPPVCRIVTPDRLLLLLLQKLCVLQIIFCCCILSFLGRIRSSSCDYYPSRLWCDDDTDCLVNDAGLAACEGSEWYA